MEELRKNEKSRMKKQPDDANVYDLVQERLKLILPNSTIFMFLFRAVKIVEYFLTSV